MKVEIELRDLETLKNQLDEANVLIERYLKKLSEYSEDGVNSKVIKLADALTNKYLEAIFKSLGFNDSIGVGRPYLKFNHDFNWSLKDSWYDSEKIRVDLDIEIRNQFKAIILSLGVITNE